jgi:hypothetical protein
VRVLVLREVFGEDVTFVDVGDPGDSIGDYVVFHDVVQNYDSGEEVGRIDVQCISGYADQCRGSITLYGDGQIVFDGVTLAHQNPDRFAITGGTGVYGDVRGKLIVSFPSSDSARLAVHLIGA